MVFFTGWEFAHRISERIAVFCQKVSEWAIRLKSEWFAYLLIFGERFAHLLIFGEQPEQFAHDCSFLLSNLSESLKRNERIFGFFKKLQKM